MPYSAPVTIAQYISMLVIIYIVAVDVIWMIKNPDKWLWAMPLILWMVHNFVYYMCVQFQHHCFPMLNDIELRELFTSWSAFLRLHGYFSFAILESSRLQLSLKIRNILRK
jgi:hypothetical protein